MTVSLAALQAMFVQQTDQIFLACIRIEHASLATPLRFVNDMQDLVRADGNYLAFPFQITLPQDTDTEQPQVTLTISNVDRTIVQMLRTLSSAPTVTLEIVLRSSPNTVEVGPFVFVVRSSHYDALNVALTLGYEVDLLDLPANKFRVTPALAPGSF